MVAFILSFVGVALITAVRGERCTGNIAACLAPDEQVAGQNECIRSCEIECLGQEMRCMKTTRCQRCLAKAFIGCGLGDRACIEGLQSRA